MATDYINYDYGVDLKSDFTFTDGDIKLAEYEENIGQAIANRLNTYTNSLDIFYNGYGSFFTQFFGWRRRQTTLDMMKTELETTLAEDPRITQYSTELWFMDDGSVGIRIEVYDREVTELNFVLTGDGVTFIEEE